jgi:hypothetical protein
MSLEEANGMDRKGDLHQRLKRLQTHLELHTQEEKLSETVRIDRREERGACAIS